MNVAMTLNGKTCTVQDLNSNLKTTGVSILLTFSILRFMLYPLSQKTKVGFDIPRKGEKSPLPLVVFFRPQFLIGTGLIRAKFIMVDCLRGLYESARSFAGMSTLLNPPPMLDIIGGGYSLLTKDTAIMNTSKNLTPRAKATPDDDGIIRVTDPDLRPPKGYFQLCVSCRFDKFSAAYHYCPQCGCSALSHGVYVAKNGGAA